MNLKDKLNSCHKEKSALFAFNFYNFETLKGVVTAAAAFKKEIILQLTKSSIEYMGLQPAVKLARSILSEYNVNGWIHLDHSASVDLCKACLDAGFDSVMIDASERPFEENIKVTRQVVEFAKSFNANVEAELGYVAKLGQDYNKQAFTNPEDAKKFVDETGINALAVAIGSAHGFYKGTPKLNIDLLREINNTVDIPLVLHGGSGIPDDQILKAVKNGICKINVATEIKNIFMKTLQSVLAENEEIDLRKVFPPAIKSVQELIIKKLSIFHLVD